MLLSLPYRHGFGLLAAKITNLFHLRTYPSKKILSENQEGHNRLAQLLIDKEVIFAEDVEHIFGKRPWASRSEEISANKTAAELKKAEQEEEQKAIEAEKEVKEEEKHEK